MILTVHDELLFEVPKARAEEFAAIVRDEMQSAAVDEGAADGRRRRRRELEGREELTILGSVRLQPDRARLNDARIESA